MNGIEPLLLYRDLQSQIYGLWRNAVVNKKIKTRKEIRKILNRSLPRFIAEKYPVEGFRARLVKPKDYKDLYICEAESLFRGRSGLQGFPSDLMGAPPKKYTTVGRANRKHRPILSLASDIQTACSEVQPLCEALISVSKFTVVEGLTIVDFREIPSCLQSINQNDPAEKIQDAVFCKSILDLFSIPVGFGEHDLYQYSQYIAALLAKEGIAGILYPSSHNFTNSSFNFALFNPQNARCGGEHGDLFTCLSVQSTFQNISVNCSRRDVEILTARRDRDPVLWNETAMLRKDMGNAKA